MGNKTSIIDLLNSFAFESYSCSVLYYCYSQVSANVSHICFHVWPIIAFSLRVCPRFVNFKRNVQTFTNCHFVMLPPQGQKQQSWVPYPALTAVAPSWLLHRSVSLCLSMLPVFFCLPSFSLKWIGYFCAHLLVAFNWACNLFSFTKMGSVLQY